MVWTAWLGGAAVAFRLVLRTPGILLASAAVFGVLGLSAALPLTGGTGPAFRSELLVAGAALVGWIAAATLAGQLVSPTHTFPGALAPSRRPVHEAWPRTGAAIGVVAGLAAVWLPLGWLASLHPSGQDVFGLWVAVGCLELAASLVLWTLLFSLILRRSLALPASFALLLATSSPGLLPAPLQPAALLLFPVSPARWTADSTLGEAWRWASAGLFHDLGLLLLLVVGRRERLGSSEH